MPTNQFEWLLWLIAGVFAVMLLPAVFMLLIEALPLIVAIVVGLWVYNHVL